MISNFEFYIQKIKREGKMEKNKKFEFTWIKVAVVALAIAFLFLVLHEAWALLKADHTVGGNVTFTANNIHATISSGTVAGGTLADAENKLKSVEFNMNTDSDGAIANANIATWSGLNLTFNDSADDITITFTITNNNVGSNLKVGLNTPTGTLTNATMTTTFNGTESNSEVILKNVDNNPIYVTVVITFTVTDKNVSASISDFSLPFYLENTTEDATVTTVAFTYEIVDNYIYFGEWPQTLKASDVTITDDTPDSDGYFDGSDGERYAKYTINLAETYGDYYEQFSPMFDGYDMNKTTDGTLLQDNNTYYFKVEKLRWRILSQSEDSALIVCDSIIQQQTYQSNYIQEGSYCYVTEDGSTAKEVDGTKIFANNYKYSELRNFLITEFYEKAFNDLQETLIMLTTVDNSASTTNSDTNNYVCENTEDFIFSLSYADLVNTEYQFKADSSAMDVARMLPVTDFAMATGAAKTTKKYCDENGMDEDTIIAALVDAGYSNEEASAALETFYNAGAWWLRSPLSSISPFASGVIGGGSGNGDYVFNPMIGVVPALQISL